MRARQLHELNARIVKKNPQWAMGFVAACELLDSMYSSSSTHKFLLGDCLLAKANLLGKHRRVRVNNPQPGAGEEGR